MKLTALFLLLGALHLSAHSLSQTVTYRAKDASLKDILTVVKKQTGFAVLYDVDALKTAKPVTIAAQQQPLIAFLDSVFKGQPLTYKIESSSIIVLERDATPPMSKAGESLQNVLITVTGRVVNEKGEPVIATIIVKGTNNGTTSAPDGSFVLNNVENNAILIITGVSIETKEVKVNGSTTLTIKATTKVSEEDEVTVSTGYLSSSKRKSTANISKVTAADIEKQPVTSPLMALQGRVTGLDISPGSGVAAAAPKIRIRGENSLRENTGGNPLYVIDGVPVDPQPVFSSAQFTVNTGFDPLAAISPSNIESIEVLKDGAATGIYGSRGANGVILVTTKKAKDAEGQTRLDLNYYTGIGKIARQVDVLNTQEYLAIRREALRNDGTTPGQFDFDINGVYDTTRYTNWQKELLGKSAHINDIQLFLSGGNSHTNFRVGGNLHNETTIYPGNFGYRNITGSANITHTTANNKFRISLTVSYMANTNKIASSSLYVTRALTMPPNAPKLYDDEGKLNWEMVPVNGGALLTNSWTNPLSYLKNTQEVNGQNFYSNLTTEYRIIPALTFKTNLGLTALSSNEVNKYPIAAYSPVAIGPYTTGLSAFNNVKRNSWIIEPQLVFTKKIKDHNISAVAGGSLQQSRNALLGMEGSGYKSDALLNSIQAAPVRSIFYDNDNQYRYVAGFGLLHYDFKDRYILDVNMRRDGSSRFGPGKQFGNFGGVGLAWIFSGEKALQYSPVLSYGKLRGSYAVTGNDQIDDYQFYGTYISNPTPYIGQAAIYPAVLFNPNLSWESTKKLEIAMELGFFRNRVMIDLAFYRNRSSSQLVSYQLPLTTGFEGIVKNLGATVQNTGLELAFTSKNISNRHFSWTSAFNITVPRNKLVSFPGIELSSYAQKYQVGKSLAIQNQYHYTGVDPQTGIFTFLDVDSNGTINTADRVFTYTNDKNFYGGLSNVFTWKSFSLSFLLQFVRQPGTKMMPGIVGYSFNQLSYVLDRWQKPGDITNVQKANANFSLAQPYADASDSDYTRQDASFVRMKTLSLTWSVPTDWSNRLKIRQAKIFLQGQNLFTISGFKGYDPETGPISLPPLRMITAGLQCNF